MSELETPLLTSQWGRDATDQLAVSAQLRPVPFRQEERTAASEPSCRREPSRSHRSANRLTNDLHLLTVALGNGEEGAEPADRTVSDRLLRIVAD